MAEIEFSISTFGGCTLGFSSNLRSGTCANAALSTAAAGTYADRWLNVTHSLNSATGAGTVTASGFSGTINSYTYSFTESNTAPTYLNLGTDYSSSAGVTGTTYYDNVNLSAVPEPFASSCLLQTPSC